MKKLFLSGTGKMGQMIAGLAKEQGIEVVGTADVNTVDALKSTVVQADAVIDFSHRDMLEPLAEFVRKNHMALVCGTTGLEEKHHAILKELSCEVPVLYSANFSIGIAVLRRLAAQAAAALGDSFDIEIVETHHNQKVDAPSGTAKILLDAVNPNGEYTPVYGRQGMCGARTKKRNRHARFARRYRSGRAYCALFRHRGRNCTEPPRRQPPHFCRRCAPNSAAALR